jgi:hypothetical protein
MLEFSDVFANSQTTQVYYLLSAAYLLLLLGGIAVCRAYLTGRGPGMLRHPFMAAGIVVVVALATLMGVAFGKRPAGAQAAGPISIEDMHRATDVNFLPERTVAVPF